MTEEKTISKSHRITKSIDELKSVVSSMPPADCPLDHTFTPGLYARSIFMPEDALVISETHLTTHPYIISQGEVLVSVNEGEWIQYTAPYLGITEPGTRRVLVILKPCIWTTFHAIPEDEHPKSNSEEDRLVAVKKIENRILEKPKLTTKKDTLWLT